MTVVNFCSLQMSLKEISLNFKILSGYLIVLAVIGSIILILLHERDYLQEIEAGVVVTRDIRHDINTAHRNITELATLGEFVICWEDTDYQTYQKKRLNTDILLQKLKQRCAEFIRPEKIDTLRGLLAGKEQHLLHIMQTFHKQKKADSLLINRLPIVAKQATYPSEIIRKKKGLAGLFGKKETMRVTAPAKPLHELNEQLIEMQEERKHNLENYTGMLKLKNTELNSELMSLILQLDNLTQTAFKQKEERLEEMRQKSFTLMVYISVAAITLLLISYVIIQRDIQQKEKTRRALEESIRQNKVLLDMRKKIILTISHDIRGPLGNINGSAELAMDTRDKRKRNNHLSNIQASCRHILHLANNLLDIYRMNEGKESKNDIPFRIDKLIERITAGYLRASNDKGLLFTTQVSGIETTVHGDVDRIEQILDNLLTNAIKFTRIGELHLIVTYENGLLIMEVRDTGIGINEENLSHIFIPFERAAQEVNSQGFGLGLSITKGLVSLLDGEITVESSVGKGSTFRVTLPLAETQEREKEENKLIPNNLRLPRQVLVVDDDSVQLEVIKEMLERNGVFCKTCSNAKEVVQAFREQNFDLILTDVQMPDMDGFNLLKLLRNSNIGNSRTVPIMVMTARGDSNAYSFAEAGFLDCIHKPFSTQELLSFISSGVVKQENYENGSDDFKALTSEMSDKHKILKLFVEESERSIIELQEALEKANRKQLCETVHRMFPVWELLQTDDILQTYRQTLHDKNINIEKVQEETRKIVVYTRELIMSAKNEITCLRHESKSIDC